jgi:hypothetical protein
VSQTNDHTEWLSANQQYLMAQVRRVLHSVASRLPAEASAQFQAPPEIPAWTLEPVPALEQLVELFDLSPFERDILLLCAAMDFEGRTASLCSALQGDERRDYPTFSLVLSALPEAHWSALTPDGVLRLWQLIELEGGRTLTHSPLRIDERILHYLTGSMTMDERLAQLMLPLSPVGELVPSQAGLAAEVTTTWVGAEILPVIQLCGLERSSKQTIAAAACAKLGLDLYRLPLAALPSDPADLARLVRLWRREAVLSNSVLFLDADGHDERADSRQESSLNQLVESTQLLILSGETRRGPWSRPALTFDVGSPTPAEQRALWQDALGERSAGLNGHIDQLVAQFNLPAPTISAVVDAAYGSLSASEPISPEDLSQALWQGSRHQARPRLDDMAQRIEPAAGWDDLVLPGAQKEILREISLHVRQRAQVYEAWDFRSKGQRGLGISALFAGASGTGKTMAAEVLADELQLDLYRIDLSAVVSKYIGETEKNLRWVFDAAEAGGAILLFDEADALFGKRSEVKDSHDRHANIEVSYLLQRMEAYRGLAILTSNMKEALDSAFMRRLRFVVDFPFPNAADRAAIWARIFPAATPTEGLDFDKLAQLNITGGNIRNIALYAAFLAAEAREPVRMAHLLHAARREYGKLEKSLTQSEIRGWTDEG